MDVNATAQLETRHATAPRYSYRRLDISELAKVNELYNACHVSSRPLAEAEWLYKDNPNGTAVIMAAFDENGELVGVRPALPWKFWWRGTQRSAYEFADAMVAPQHRKRGIFTRLVQQLHDFAAESDALQFTIPNGNSLPIYQRMPLVTVIGSSETRVKPISWPRYLGYRMGLNGHETRRAADPAVGSLLKAGDVRLTPVERFDAELERVHSDLVQSIAGFTVRDSRFLQWRYFGSPVRSYRVAHLLDVYMKPDRALAHAAFGLLIDWAAHLGAIAIHFNASQGNFFHGVAAQCGFWLKKTSGALVVDSRSAACFTRDSNGRLDIADLYFVMGDFDFF